MSASPTPSTSTPSTMPSTTPSPPALYFGLRVASPRLATVAFALLHPLGVFLLLAINMIMLPVATMSPMLIMTALLTANMATVSRTFFLLSLWTYIISVIINLFS